jgi:hypothetical protein
MAYRKTWTVRVPVMPGADDEDTLLWLMRESAETTAAGYLLNVIEFTDLGEVPLEDIAPIGLKQLGPSFVGAKFRAFRVVAERPPLDA